jgi:translation elongation factor EF-G
LKTSSWTSPRITAEKVIDMVTRRKGEMLIMESKGEMQHLEFEIPSRGLIGLRSNMLTNTAGEAVMAHRFLEYKPWKGPIPGGAMASCCQRTRKRPQPIPSINCRIAVPSLSIRVKKYTSDRSSLNISNQAT